MSGPALNPKEKRAGGSPRIEVFGESDPGLIREENQDTFAILRPEGCSTAGMKGILLVIADGMGGLAGGGTASRIAVDTIREAFRAGETGEPLAALSAAVRQANLQIYSRSGELPNRMPMGTTVTAVTIAGSSAWIAHVGDSRAYRIHPSDAIRRLTQDHTWVEELSRRGEISPTSLQYSLHRNVLTRGLGLKQEVEVDLVEIHDLEPGEVILLCSDGLHEMVGDAEIESCTRARGADVKGLTADLIRLACERGGPDNITVLVARVGSEVPADPPSVRAGEAGGAEVGGEERERLFPRKGFMPLSILAAFALGVGTVLLLEKTAPEEPTRPPGDLLEGVLEDLEGPQNRAVSDTPEGRKLREALQDFLRKTREMGEGSK